MQKLSLTNKYTPYSNYKRSQVEWIAQIPEGWEIKKIRRMFQIKKRIAGKLDIDVLSITQKGIKVKNTKDNEGQLSADYSKYQLVEKGDFAMNHMDLLTGYVDISKYDGVTSPDYRVFTRRESSTFDRYFLYLFQMGYHQKLFYPFGRGAAQLGRWRFPAGEFNNFFLPVPPKDEQEKIAQFLDEQTIRIDETIAKKQKLIELLKEKRTAVINHAVTKGLDPKAELVDSGIEWIGKIPRNWRLEKLKYLAPLVILKTTIENATSDYIALENAEGKTGRYLPSPELVNPDSIVTVFGKGDVLFSKLRPYLAKVLTPGFDGFATGEFLVLRPKKIVVQGYLKYRLLSQDFITIVNDSTYGAQMPRASWNFIGSQFITLPPTEEQEKIVLYLDGVIDEFQSFLDKVQKSVTLLQELKSSLISHAVTGKIKV